MNQAKEGVTVALISALQIGQLERFWTHFLQQKICPHGTSTTSANESIQTLQTADAADCALLGEPKPVVPFEFHKLTWLISALSGCLEMSNSGSLSSVA